MVESKSEMIKRLGRSPDYGDALCLTFARRGAIMAGTGMHAGVGTKPANIDTGWIV